MMRRKYQLRTLRNLTVTALLLALLWWTVDCPLPTAEMELHRAERQRMMEESTVVFRCESEGELIDPTMLVGVTEDSVHTSSHTHFLNIWPREPEGPTLVILPSELRYSGLSISPLTIGLVAVDPPSRAQSARLTLTLAVSGEEMDYIMEAQRQEQVFFFQLESRYPNVTASSGSAAVQAAEAEKDAFSDLFHWTGATRPMPPYTLEFFGADGELIQTSTN